MIYAKGSILHCPHCGKSAEDPVEDFVIPMRYTVNTEECEWCGETFRVREDRLTHTFEVTK